jgi:hypothetical protein
MLKILGVIMLAILGLGRQATAQEVSLALLHPVVSPLGVTESGVTQPGSMEAETFTTSFETATVQRSVPDHHRFWDRENSFLFATNAALSAADFVVTRDNLRGGGRELNPVTGLFSGSTAGLAANFTGETAGVIGLSYVLHKTGHHRLERLASVVNIGSSAAAVTFDLAHR